MSEQTLKVKTLYLRNDTADTWVEKNPVLAKGEPGVEVDRPGRLGRPHPQQRHAYPGLWQCVKGVTDHGQNRKSAAQVPT